jgi:peptide/nickel transport system substrate-binding protein
LREFVAGQRVIFDAWDGSWRGTPKVKTVEGYVVADPATLVNGLKSGQFNLIKDPPLDQIESLKSQGFTVSSAAAWRVYLLEFNQSPLFADSRVRQALNYAVDVKTIANRVFFGYATPAPGQMAGAGTFGYSSAVGAFPYDPLKAKALLDEAGWKVDSTTGIRTRDGKQFEITAEYGAGDIFNVGEGSETQAVQQYLSDVGIKVKLLASERGAMLPRLTSNQARFELTHGGWGALPIPDADFVYSNFSCKERTDRYPVCDPSNAEFEQLYATQKTQVDSAQRVLTWGRIAQVVHDRPIGIYMVQPSKTWIAKGITGVTPRADEITLFDGLAVGR